MSKAKISKNLQSLVKSRDGHTCRACGFGGAKKFAAHLVCDHAHSERNGGETSLDNLQTLCGPCNTLKGSKNWAFPIREASKKWDLNYIWISRFFDHGCDRAILKNIKWNQREGESPRTTGRRIRWKRKSTRKWKAKKSGISKRSWKDQNDYLHCYHIGRRFCRMGRNSQIRRLRPINAAPQRALFLRCGIHFLRCSMLRCGIAILRCSIMQRFPAPEESRKS